MMATKQRCEECGKFLLPTASSCSSHPHAALIKWDRGHVYAQDYVMRVPNILDVYDPVYYPGVTQRLLYLTRERLIKWGLYPPQERPIASGLYGQKP